VRAAPGDGLYQGEQGLDQERIEQLKKLYGLVNYGGLRVNILMYHYNNRGLRQHEDKFFSTTLSCFILSG